MLRNLASAPTKEFEKNKKTQSHLVRPYFGRAFNSTCILAIALCALILVMPLTHFRARLYTLVFCLIIIGEAKYNNWVHNNHALFFCLFVQVCY